MPLYAVPPLVAAIVCFLLAMIVKLGMRRDRGKRISLAHHDADWRTLVSVYWILARGYCGGLVGRSGSGQ